MTNLLLQKVHRKSYSNLKEIVTSTNLVESHEESTKENLAEKPNVNIVHKGLVWPKNISCMR